MEREEINVICTKITDYSYSYSQLAISVPKMLSMEGETPAVPACSHPANESCPSCVHAAASLPSAADDTDPDGCRATDFGFSCDSISLSSSVASSNVFYRKG